MRSSLVKSLLIDFLFTTVRLSHGDDACGGAATGRVRDHYGAAGQQTQGDEALLSIIEAIIDECDTGAVEHESGFLEGQTVLDEIGTVLRFVPFISHL